MTGFATDEPEGRDGAASDLNEAVRVGLRRAGLHWMRAGYEVLAGVGAFLDEIVAAAKGEASAGDETGPTKIELD